jgi:hypothetical protein
VIAIMEINSMSSSKIKYYFSFFICVLFASAANSATPLPACSNAVYVMADSSIQEGLFFQSDNLEKLVSKKRMIIELNGFSFYEELNGAFAMLSPYQNIGGASKYNLKGYSNIFFACGYNGGAIVLHDVSKYGIKECIVKNNTSRSRSISCK